VKRDPKGRERGVGVLGGGSKPPSYPSFMGLGDQWCKLLQLGPGEALENVVLVHFGASKIE